MVIQSFFRLALFSALLTSWQSLFAAPNIVFLYADDLGYRDLGCMGSDFYETPRIDSVASEGMAFTSAYACAPNCAPSRACLLSGYYSPRHGVFTVGDPERGNDSFRKLVPTPNNTTLADEFVTLAEALQDADYRTGGFGKWHLGGEPTKQGFDVFVQRQDLGFGRGYFRQRRTNEEGAGRAYLTEELAALAANFVRENRDESFFLYLSFHSVHTPIQAREALVEKYEAKQPGERHNHPMYAAMVESLDTAVGVVLDELEQQGLAEETLVIFYSDNGGYGPATTMVPLRGSKGMLYEGGVRVPLLVRWPAVVEAGSRSDETVIGVDFYPTLLEIAGRPLAEAKDGVSFVPLLRQKGTLDRDALYWHFPAYLEAYRRELGPFRTTPAGAIRSGDWKLIEYFEDGRLELYNLRDDVGEQHNLANDEPTVAARLHQQMAEWREEVSAPVPSTTNPKYDPRAEWRP